MHTGHMWLLAAVLDSTAVDCTSSLGSVLGFPSVFQNLKIYSGNHSLLKIQLWIFVSRNVSLQLASLQQKAITNVLIKLHTLC